MTKEVVTTVTRMTLPTVIIETVTQIDADDPRVLILKPRDLKGDEPFRDSFYEAEAAAVVAFLDKFFCRRTIKEIKRQLVDYSEAVQL